jgi:hypothetical protein
MSEAQPTGGGLTSMNGWWAASGLLIVLVVVGVVVVIFTGGDHTPSTAPPTTAPTTVQSRVPDTTGNDEPLMSAPPTEWELFYDIALPTSPTAGPAVQEGRLWSGYEHSPEGALMAAAYLLVATDTPEASTVVERQMVKGPAAQAYVNQLSVSPPQTPVPGTTPAFGGFRFVTYTASDARVEFVALADGHAATIPVDVTWQDGDWKINLETSGGQPVLTRANSAAGFIPWSAS